MRVATDPKVAGRRRPRCGMACRNRSARNAAGVVVLMIGVLGPATGSLAAVIVPSTTTDDNAINGNCTLREAIQSANADASVDSCSPGSGPDRVQLGRGVYTLGVAGSGEDAAQTGDLDVTGDLAIVGDPGGSVVDAAGSDRVLDIHAGDVSVEALTLRGGDARIEAGLLLAPPGAGDGGAISSKGGHVVVDRSAVLHNSARNGGGIAAEGGPVTLTASTVSGNTASDEGGGVWGDSGQVAVAMSTLRANAAGEGLSSYRLSGSTGTLKGSIVEIRCGDLSGATSLGFNLLFGSSLADCRPETLQATDIWNRDPELTSLGDHGGSTETWAFGVTSLTASLAFDNGPPASDPDCGGQLDQRGLPRPQPAGGRCDIGAFEYGYLHEGCQVGRYIFLGTAVADDIVGTADNDLMLGDGGRDRLTGLDGDDCLDGGDAIDRLRGGDGADVLVGWQRFDRLWGGEGDDELYGGTGDGVLKGGPGDDYLLDGYLGGDLLPVSSSEDAVLVGGPGDDVLDGLRGRDRMSGGAGDDKIYGGGHDQIDCGPGKDIAIVAHNDKVSPDCERVR